MNYCRSKCIISNEFHLILLSSNEFDVFRAIGFFELRSEDNELFGKGNEFKGMIEQNSSSSLGIL